MYDVGVNNEKVSEIKSLLFRLYVFYCALLLGGGQPSNGAAISSVIVVPKGNADHYQSARLARVAQMREHKDIVEIESEVDRYLLDSAKNIESEVKLFVHIVGCNLFLYHIEVGSTSTIASDITLLIEDF